MVEEKITKLNIEFIDESTQLLTLYEKIDSMKTVKIEVTTAIFIHKEHVEEDYLTIDVIPFNQIKSCKAVFIEDYSKEVMI